MSAVDFTSVSPIVPVRDLDVALGRYRRLGFAVHAYEGPERYGFADRGSVSIHLTEWAEHDPLRENSPMSIPTALRTGSDHAGPELRRFPLPESVFRQLAGYN